MVDPGLMTLVRFVRGVRSSTGKGILWSMTKVSHLVKRKDVFPGERGSFYLFSAFPV